MTKKTTTATVQERWTRRHLLRVGGLTALGVGLADAVRRQSAVAAGVVAEPRARACILIWLDGGPSHLETFDPKPDAPREVRGPFGSVGTCLPGVRVGEGLERTAKILDKVALVRSVTSTLGEHNFGTHYLLTGYKPSPTLEYPTFGSTLAQVRSHPGVLPPYVAIPHLRAGGGGFTGNGYLPEETRPFSVGGNPAASDFKVRDLDFYHGLDLARLHRRRRVVTALDAFLREKEATTEATDPDLERACDLIASPRAKSAFALDEEAMELRDRYGRGSALGQGCLLARRLVERGVPFVTVNHAGWDTHVDLRQLKERFPRDRNAHLPSLDRAFSSLVSDLDERGLLSETLVVVLGEFGRTPKVNSAAGRDHWPNVFSVALAGGGVRGGQVHGSSDVLAESPRDDPVTPADLAATIYTLLGVAPQHELTTRDGRPVRVAPAGARVIEKLIGG